MTTPTGTSEAALAEPIAHLAPSQRQVCAPETKIALRAGELGKSIAIGYSSTVGGV
jgi:hypothetical protein